VSPAMCDRACTVKRTRNGDALQRLRPAPPYGGVCRDARPARLAEGRRVDAHRAARLRERDLESHHARTVHRAA
jgi:hypothetical protein